MTDHVETTLPALVFTAAYTGDVEAKGRLVIDSDGSTSTGVIWGAQSANYSAATSAALIAQCEACTLSAGTATAVGAAGASGAGSNVARTAALGTSFATTLRLTYSGTDPTHKGNYRVYARAMLTATNAGAFSARLVWGPDAHVTARYLAGDVANRAFNPAVTVPASAAYRAKWLLLDLGIVRPKPTELGTHRWLAYIDALSTVNTDSIDWDCLFLVPIDDGYGEAVADGGVVVGSGQSLQISNDSALAQFNATSWGLVDYEGSYLRVKPGTSQYFVKRILENEPGGFWYVGGESRFAFDPTINSISAKVFAAPRYLSAN